MSLDVGGSFLDNRHLTELLSVSLYMFFIILPPSPLAAVLKSCLLILIPQLRIP